MVELVGALGDAGALFAGVDGAGVAAVEQLEEVVLGLGIGAEIADQALRQCRCQIPTIALIIVTQMTAKVQVVSKSKSMKSLQTLAYSWIVVFQLVATTQAQEKKSANKGVDPATVAAYVKLGGMYGGVRVGLDGELEFIPGPEGAVHHLPSFKFETPELEPSKLPAVNVPFGIVFDVKEPLTLTGLTALKHLQLLDISGRGVTVAGQKRLAGLKQLQTLSLAETGTKNDDLKLLTDLDRLQTLNLVGTGVTDAGLHHLAGLGHLRTLNLIGTDVTDKGLKHLARCKQLETLALGGPNITGVGLKDLAALEHLRSLRLFRSNVTDAGLKHLAGLKLYTLRLRSNDLKFMDLKPLAELKQLHTLDLSISNVAELNGFRALGQLKSLDLSHTSVTNESLKELAGLKQLQTLELAGTRITDAGLKELAGFKQLQTLNLAGTRITDAGLKELVGHKNLQALHVDDTKVTDDGLRELKKAIPSLKVLRR